MKHDVDKKNRAIWYINSSADKSKAYEKNALDFKRIFKNLKYNSPCNASYTVCFTKSTDT